MTRFTFYISFAVLSFVFFSAPVYASCSPEGALRYNSTQKVYEFCTGTEWALFGGSSGGSGGGGATECPSTTIAWGNCSDSLSAAPIGTTTSLSDSAGSCGGWGGSATAECMSSGGWQLTSSSCTYESNSCGDDNDEAMDDLEWEKLTSEEMQAEIEDMRRKGQLF